MDGYCGFIYFIMKKTFKQLEQQFIERDKCPDKTSIKYQLIKRIIEDKIQSAGISIGSEQITLEIIEVFFDAEQLTEDMKNYLNYCHFHEDLAIGRGQDQ